MSPEFMRRWSLVTVVAASAMVAACGGGSGYSGAQPPPPTGNPPPPPPPGASRGDIVKAKVLGQLSVATINGQTNFATSLVHDTATCPVTVVSLQYTTIDPSGALATAGMGLLVPDEANGCPSGASGHPLLSHQHGTSVNADFDTADTDPSHIAAGMSAMFASHGYVVAMPNYLGYGGSSVDWHSYLVAGPSGAVVVDSIRAARNWIAANAKSTHLSGDVYLAGTSQGGYVTLATQYVIESDSSLAAEIHLRGNAPTSGPYDLAGRFLTDMTQADPPDNSDSAVAAFALYAMQRTYGDVYSNPNGDPTDVFNTPWAANFNTTKTVLMPGPYNTEAQLIKNCVLPFNLKDPGGPDNFGCGNTPLLTSTFVTQYLAHTAGTTGGAAWSHAQANTLVVAGPTSAQKWTPVAPITFCYGDIDTVVVQSAVEGANLANATTVDVQADTTEPAYIYQYMQANKGDSQYHGNVEAPGCTSYAKNVLFPRPY